MAPSRVSLHPPAARPVRHLLAVAGLAVASFLAAREAFAGTAGALRPAESPGRAGATARAAKAVLYDVPVSNNGAKVRLLIYKKGLPVDVVSPPSSAA